MKRNYAAATAAIFAPARAALAALLAGTLLIAAPVAAVRAAPPVPPKTPPVDQPQRSPGSAAQNTSIVPAPDDAQQILKDAPSGLAYPDASKITINDLSDITVRPDGTTRSVTRQTLKILNKRGRDEAEVKIPYNSTYETVKVIRARTIKPDGKVVPLDMSQIHDQTINEDDATYTDAKMLTFSMPAVDDGSIIDYEYVTDEKEPMIKGNFWTNWYFQGDVDPVKLTRLTITVPKGMELHTQLRNTEVKPVITPLPDGKNVRYVWQDKDVAPLDIEPMMPGIDEVAPMLQVSTLPSWQTVATWFAGLAKTQQTVTPEIKTLVAQLTEGKATPEEKARAIFYYVEDKTRYVSIDFGKSAFQPHPAAETCANQYGDCKDMTNLLITMLHEAGIDADAALLNMGSKSSKSDQLPSLSVMDHVVCHATIGGKEYWLDATAQVCPWGVIPSADRGAQALVVHADGKGEWVTIPDGTPEDNETSQDVRLTLNADGSASGTITLTGSGDTDMSLRGALEYLPPDKLTPYLESMAQNIGANPRVTNVKLSDYKDKDKPVSIAMDVTFPSWANQSDDVLIFKARPEQSKGSSSSPFRDDVRRLPVEQNSAALAVSFLEVKLPSGYSVLSAPKSTDVKSDLGRFSRQVKVDGDKLDIEMRGENYHADVPAFRYADVRKYYDTYLKAFEQSVIVKKN